MSLGGTVVQAGTTVPRYWYLLVLFLAGEEMENRLWLLAVSVSFLHVYALEQTWTGADQQRPRKKALMFVLSHSKRNKGGVSGLERRMGIRNTWKHGIPSHSLFRFVLDRNTADTDAEVRQYNDMLFLNTSEAGQARGFGIKLRKLVRWSLDNYKFDVFMRIDDDNFLCTKHLFHDLDELLAVSKDFIWGWWFGPTKLYNPDANTDGPGGPSADRFCQAFSAKKKPANNWRPDEMGMIIAEPILRNIFTNHADKDLPVHDLMDVTMMKWVADMDVTYVVDNARFYRGAWSYGPDKLPPSHDVFCLEHISFHKAHPKAMQTMWESLPQIGETSFKKLELTDSCLSPSSKLRSVSPGQ